MTFISALSLLQGISLGDYLSHYPEAQLFKIIQGEQLIDQTYSAPWQRLLGGDLSGTDSYSLHLKSCIIGYLSNDALKQLPPMMKQLSVVTIDDANLYASCLASAGLIANSCRRITSDSLLKTIFALTDSVSDDFDQALRRVGHVVGWGSQNYAIRHIHHNDPHLATIPFLIYTLMRDELDLFSTLAMPQSNQLIKPMLGAIIGVQSPVDAIWRKAFPTAQFDVLLERIEDLAEVTDES